MKILNYISISFYNDFQRWLLWLPVLVGFGISLYFSLSFEPPLWVGGLGIFAFIFSFIFVRLRVLHLLAFSIGFIFLGFSASLFRTHLLNTVMLHYPLSPLVLEGRVQQVELKPTLKGTFYQRLILTDLKAETPEKLPQKIRVSLKGKRERLWPGQRIQIKAKLLPVSEPSTPNGFDFRRQAYFNGLGATGFSLSPPTILKSDFHWRTYLEKRREEITAYFLEKLPYPKGAIAAALITGDKSSIPDSIREDFVNSGLAHILAISGLHLTIIAGFVFMVIRRGIALIPPLCLHYNSKKIAAVGTILVTFIYLILSGFGIPAQRAFIMITAVMGATLLNRTALSMRTVAFAALLILLIMPESLLGPSFQLSFAAVVGLVSGYETWKNPLAHWIVNGGRLRKLIVYGLGVSFTSLLATLATLPFTIYLFHRFSVHAIEANLLAVPLTTCVIMPSALLTCLLTPLGLGEGPLWVFEKSISLLIQIASIVSTWPGAHLWVAHPPLFSFILVVFGGLWLCLWQQSWRKLGFIAIGAGFLVGFGGKLPDLLIDGRGKLVGLYDGSVLYVSSQRKGKFTAETWKKHLAVRETEPMTCEEGLCKMTYQDIPILISYGQVTHPCVKDAILIRLEPTKITCPEALLTLDWYDLWRHGGHALWLDSKKPYLETVNQAQGRRPWTRKAIQRKDRPRDHKND
ncbi:MAG: ComEC family competence protein [Proteobacteria bacterium]|nr:ComEC family competence protein [Pseudomonadota bacterium]